MWVSRPTALFGSVRRGTGAGEARDGAKAATRSWGTLKPAHHRYGVPRTGFAHACRPSRSGRGSASWISGGTISREVLEQKPGSVVVVLGRSTSRIQPRAIKEVNTASVPVTPVQGLSRLAQGDPRDFPLGEQGRP